MSASPPPYLADGTFTGYADALVTAYARAVVAGAPSYAERRHLILLGLDDVVRDIDRDVSLALVFATPAAVLVEAMAKSLKVVAVGPKGGKIVGYVGGDLKRPIYAGSAAAKALAAQHGHSDAGALGVAEIASQLVTGFGLSVPGSGHPTKSGSGYALAVTGTATAIAAARATYVGAAFYWEITSPTSATLMIDTAHPLAEAEHSQPKLLAAGGPAPAGWPSGHPPPGARFARTVDAVTVTLDIVDTGAGTPGYVVTSPAPLFVFTGGAYGMVHGAIDAGEPVAVQFASATAAAIAVLGPKQAPDGTWIKKSTNGPFFWGWAGKVKGQAPVIDVATTFAEALPPPSHANSALSPVDALAAHGGWPKQPAEVPKLDGDVVELWLGWLAAAPESSEVAGLVKLGGAWMPPDGDAVPMDLLAEALAASDEPLPAVAADEAVVVGDVTEETAPAAAPPEPWPWPHGPGATAQKTAPSLQKGPLNAGKPFEMVVLASGALAVTWLAGGGLYDKKGNLLGEVPAGAVETFASPTAAAQAITGTPTNGHKWWWSQPVSYGTGAAPAPETEPADMPEPEPEPAPEPAGVPAAEPVEEVPDEVEAEVEPEPAAEPAQVEAWQQDPAPEDPAWWAAAPVGAVVEVDGVEYTHTEAGWSGDGAVAIPDEQMLSPVVEVVGAPEVEPAPTWIDTFPSPSPSKSQWLSWLKAAPAGVAFDTAPGKKTGAIYVSSGGNAWTKTLKKTGQKTTVNAAYVAVVAMKTGAGSHQFIEPVHVPALTAIGALVPDDDAPQAEPAAAGAASLQQPPPPPATTPKPSSWPEWAPPPGTTATAGPVTVHVMDHAGHPSYYVEAGGDAGVVFESLSAAAQHAKAIGADVDAAWIADQLGMAAIPPEPAHYTVTKKVTSSLAPGNAGQSVQLAVGPSGFTVTWPDGGTNYLAGEAVPPGHSETFASATAAAKAIANSIVNGHVWWGLKPEPAGGVAPGAYVQAGPKPELTADELMAHLFDDEPQHDWAGWLSADHLSATEWLLAAPNGAVVHTAAGNVWKVGGAWHNAGGDPVEPASIASGLDRAASVGLQGLGPDGKTYPLGTEWAWKKLHTTKGTVVNAAIQAAFPGASVYPNPKYQGKLTIRIDAALVTDKDAAHQKLATILSGLGIGHNPEMTIVHVGGSYAYAGCDGYDADEIVKTEIKVIPLFVSEPNNNHRLEEEPHPSHSLTGLAIDADADAIRYQQVRTRLLADGSTEVTFKLTEWADATVQKALAKAPIGQWDFGGGTWNGQSAPTITHKKAALVTRELTGAGWSAKVAKAGQSYYALGGSVRLVVKPGVAVRAALDDFGSTVGLGAIAQAPSADDVELYRVMKVLWSVAPKEHDDLLAFGKPTLAQAKKKLASVGFGADAMALVREVVPHHSHRTLALGDAEKLRASGLAGLRHNWSGSITDLAESLSRSGALLSTENRWRCGIGAAGASPTSDLERGGASSAFCYPIKTGAEPKLDGIHGAGVGFVSNAVALLFGSRSLERADWYASAHDSYGSTKPNGGFYKQRPPRYDVGSKHITEVMVQGGLGLDEVVGIMAGSVAAATAVVKALESVGITHLSGVPVAQAVTASGSVAKALIDADYDKLTGGAT